MIFNNHFILIDNRTQKEFHGSTPYGSDRGGHIPNAKHIHWPDFFKKDGTLKSATDLSQIVLELLQSRTSERQGRAIDSDSGSSMEKKKQEGYF